MKSTLIEIVKDILNDMDGDYVSSINDTDEASQVAQIVKSTYQAMISNRNWPHTLRIANIIASTDNLLPTHMRLAEDFKEVVTVFYDVRKNAPDRVDYREIKYIPPDDFLRLINRRNNTDPNCSTIIDPSGVKLLIMNNKAPEYRTSFDDTTMVFDSYDSNIDSTLQASKSQIMAYIIPPFELEDDFVPDLPDEAFSALIEEAKSKAAFKLAQKQDIKAEQEANRQQRWLSRKSWRTHAPDIYPYSYGRKNAKGRRKDPTFRRD